MNKTIHQTSQERKPPTQLSVKELVGSSVDYLIPMYQRNYTWGEGEITQLIQDILDEMPNRSSEGNIKPYYIGTLVVFHTPNPGNYPVYEVIDGQQRLTTLYLLTTYLNHDTEKDSAGKLSWFTRPCVLFESRPTSSKAMQAAFKGHLTKRVLEQFHTADYNSDIINGYALIQRLMPKLCSEKGVTEQAFGDYLFNQVLIMRVEVPDDTELNHYFEIMNNRGEQLEKHEVLKSKLMSQLNEDDDRTVLHHVWEACANMERYVQMGFTSSARDRLFGLNDWNQFIARDFDELARLLVSAKENNKQDAAQPLTLLDLIQQKPPSPKENLSSETHRKEEAPERFNTVINFPNFLLQVLRAATGQDIPLDDKRLISVFEEYVLKPPDATKRVKDFVYDLLKSKYLFDQYIIKREFTAGSDGWSLQHLKWHASNKSAGYAKTFGDTDDNQKILLLLSALHVSTPTMVYKHWLNGALRFLLRNPKVEALSYLNYLASMTRCFVYDRFLAANEGLDYYEIIYGNDAKQKITSWSQVDPSKLTFGKIANNLVFNYLDYLLWPKYRKHDIRVEKYEFSFRSSVEHFYPQNPASGDPMPAASLHSFGNLCLISHSKNSQLSNRRPIAKKDYYVSGDIDSIKQWLMMEKPTWTQAEIDQHNDDMIKVFTEDLESAARETRSELPILSR